MKRLENFNGIRVYYCRNTAHVGELPGAISALGIRSDIVLEPVPCSGRIDPRHLLKAFEGGAQAVCVLACPTGQCKLMEGNLRAGRRVQTVREILAEAGLDPDSVQIFLPASAEEDTLVATTEMVGRAGALSRQRSHGVMA